jgi:hypothetical protein
VAPSAGEQIREISIDVCAGALRSENLANDLADALRGSAPSREFSGRVILLAGFCPRHGFFGGGNVGGLWIPPGLSVNGGGFGTVPIFLLMVFSFRADSR